MRRLKKCGRSVVETDDSSQLQLTTFYKTLHIDAKTNHDLQCATPDFLMSLCSIVIALLVQRVIIRVLVMKESTTVLPKQIRTRVSEPMKLNMILLDAKQKQ